LKASEKRPGKVVDYHAGLTALGLAETQAAAMRASELVAFFLTLGAEGYGTVSPAVFEFRKQQTVVRRN